MHQAWKTNPEIITQLQQAKVETLIVDECHHLQKEWWKPLINLKKELQPLLIALTATPPYDVSNFEWARYHELCGDIDEIIYTPELVAAGDLCPHQDYLYLCMPPDAASLELQDFHRAVGDFTESLQHNYRFINLLKAHPWLNQPELYTEAIYENPAYYSALLIGLEGLGKVVPLSALGIIGADESQIPALSLDRLEVLLQNALFKDPYFEAFLAEEPIERILKTLRRIGAIEKAKVHLKESPQLAKQLRNSSSKLIAIGEIAKIEALNLGRDLRMVVLCDYIRKEFLPADEMDDPGQDQLGVVPIFESLRRAFPLGLEIGVLSGWLVYLSLFNSTFILGVWSNLRRIKDPQLFWSSAAQTLFEALSQGNSFQASPEEDVLLEVDASGSNELVLVPKNLDTHSTQLYLNALQELLNPIENPRYLLALEYTFDPQIPLLYYFPVPTCLGKKKKDAERFQDIWTEKMGPTRLVFTRTLEGRLELLKARGQSLGLPQDAFAARESSWE